MRLLHGVVIIVALMAAVAYGQPTDKIYGEATKDNEVFAEIIKAGDEIQTMISASVPKCKVLLPKLGGAPVNGANVVSTFYNGVEPPARELALYVKGLSDCAAAVTGLSTLAGSVIKPR